MPREVKTERLARLIELQKRLSLEANRRLVGSELRVLVKEIGRDEAFVVGHSDQNHTVLVPREQVRAMGLTRVVVERATPHALYGRLPHVEPEAIELAMVS